MAVGDVWAVQRGTSWSGTVRPSSGVEVCLTYIQQGYYNSSNFGSVYVTHASAGSYPFIGSIWYGSSPSAQFEGNYDHTHAATLRMTYPFTYDFYIVIYATGSPFGSDFRGIITKE